MSKGYLYDTGDELITRDGNEKIPTISSEDAGGSLIVNPSGEIVVKPYDLTVPVAFNGDTSVLELTGYTFKDIKDCLSNGGNVYFLFMIQDSATHTRRSVGFVYKVNFTLSEEDYIGIYAAPVSVITSEGSTTMKFISFVGKVSTISDASTSLTIAAGSIRTLIGSAS